MKLKGLAIGRVKIVDGKVVPQPRKNLSVSAKIAQRKSKKVTVVRGGR